MIALMTAIMRPRFRLYRRYGGVFYVFDRQTRRRESLTTADPHIARRLLHAKNEAQQTPLVNRHIARAYLGRSRDHQAHLADRDGGARENKEGDQPRALGTRNPRPRLRPPPQRAHFQTQPDHFLRVLDKGTVATNVFLRRMHNFAVDLGWLPWPVIPKRQWPAVRYGEKRATLARVRVEYGLVQ
jgi:hypothetical protein